MKYRRALFLVDPGKDPGSGLAVLRRAAPTLERLLIVLPSPSPSWWWARSEPTPELDADTRATLDGLRAAAQGVAPTIDVEAVPAIGADAIAELCVSEELDLLVFGARSRLSLAVHRKRLPIAVLWAEGVGEGPITAIACVVQDDRSLAAIAAFLRDHGDRSTQVALLSPAALGQDFEASVLPVSGIEARVEVSSPSEAHSMGEWLDEWARTRSVELFVFVGSPNAVLLGERQGPVLLVPPLATTRSFGRRVIDVPDLLDVGGPIRVRVEQLVVVGSPSPAAGQSIAFVAGGRVVANVVTSASGEAELLPGLDAAVLGVYGMAEGATPDPLAAIEQTIAVVRPSSTPLPIVVFDADLPDEVLRALVEASPSAAWLAVRLRPVRSCRFLRDRLRGFGLPALVVDARAVLDEGEALDVSDAFDGVRLVRVVARLQRAGFVIAAMIHAGPVPPIVREFAVLGPSELGELAHATGKTFEPAFPIIPGNRVELELDNHLARTWLLDAIASSTTRLHLQVYMATDDEFGATIEAALAAAGARGVEVRVLVDSLHGLHGSFGTRNSLLERLAARPGVELRLVRPINELPSLTDLKRRDHRKLTIADGKLALLGGRNLASEYYVGFDEVALAPDSDWRSVPWLDSGARVEGPAVEALEASFLLAWTDAGGTAFPIVASPSLGSSPVRVVVHRGLRDAHGLEVYRAMIDEARTQILVANGFPLALELQHALLRALRRGVRVRTLFGRPAPSHGGVPFSGSWSAARTTATELVHSRMDPIIEAGGECYLFAPSPASNWAPGLGVVHAHVHAKVLSVDGLRCTVGSANLDITAAYWESELLLVVEDPELVRGFEGRILALMEGSTAIDRGDANWQAQAKRRAWMRHWPGVLSA
ncbi:phospholipase D-like domain-containing protein [Nannocystaceae bacterium ST9]